MHSIFYLERFVVFGWNIFRRGVHKGDKFTANIPVECTPDDIKLDTLWVKGKITVTAEDGTPIDRTRVPGYFSCDTDTYSKGQVFFECVEDSTWWCHPRGNDNAEDRIVTPIRIKAGDTQVFPVDTLAIIFNDSEATINGKPMVDPVIFEASAPVTVTAITDTYGFTFSRKK